MKISYRNALAHQTSTKSSGELRKVVYVGALLIAASISPTPSVAQAVHLSLTSASSSVLIQCEDDEEFVPEADTIVDRIQRVATHPDLRDEDEQAPPPEVVAAATMIIKEAASIMDTTMQPAVIATFFGELNVTWRTGDEIVRLACFPGGRSLIQYGDLGAPLGSYSSESDGTAKILARHLDLIAPQEVEETANFLG